MPLSSASSLPRADQTRLRRGPLAIFLLIAAVDGKVDERELATFLEVSHALAEQDRHPVVAQLMTLFLQDHEDLIADFFDDPPSPPAEVLAWTATVDRCFVSGDAFALKKALLYLAGEVANAPGLFGIRGKAGSEEQAALHVLVPLLGLEAEEPAS